MLLNEMQLETNQTPEKETTNSDKKHISPKPSPIKSERISSSYCDADEVRSNGSSASSSNRSVTNSQRVRSHETLLVRTESEESSNNVDESSRLSSPDNRSDYKAFDVISAKSNPSRCNTPDADSIHSDAEVDVELEGSSSDSPTKLSLESLIDEDGDEDEAVGDYVTPISSRAPSESSNDEDSRDGRFSPSMVELNNRTNGVGEETEDFQTGEVKGATKIGAVRNSAGDVKIMTGIGNSPVRKRMSYTLDDDLKNNSSVTVYNNNNDDLTTSKNSSPRRFINQDRSLKDTHSGQTPPLRIGFNNVKQVVTTDVTDEADDVIVKPQMSRQMQQPIDISKRSCKVSPCKIKSQLNCKRTVSVPGNHRHYDKPVEKSKIIRQCFEQLESKNWEITLKGLKVLSEIAKDEPELLDSCTPGLLARVLGKNVTNLRSQVARAACSAATQVFATHIRGIDQDLDEIAGPLLHRTADTNKFLREDCNSALDSMVEHFPPHRTIVTIANRGASHQNTIVHATTARLLLVTVTKIGSEHVMILPRDVKEKLFATTAKLLTDGNLQSRKYAKETFRLLSQCEGFRKTLTDAVPENTLRLIDKTLRSL
ncbi:PREDICTED: protein FAM179B-like [Ceratosolen solmsi marchali]|uniref:Protein FAM179B-like n=1 Tax=Ceratosolen solmsi marchali TaxID=326594 RepID=A0AAJ6YLT4_9HYME|nr:PREDICTED: protein FAM179B-like [Ceratosolen solmsi marchali]